MRSVNPKPYRVRYLFCGLLLLLWCPAFGDEAPLFDDGQLEVTDRIVRQIVSEQGSVYRGSTGISRLDANNAWAFSQSSIGPVADREFYQRHLRQILELVTNEGTGRIDSDLLTDLKQAIAQRLLEQELLSPEESERVIRTTRTRADRVTAYADLIEAGGSARALNMGILASNDRLRRAVVTLLLKRHQIATDVRNNHGVLNYVTPDLRALSLRSAESFDDWLAQGQVDQETRRQFFEIHLREERVQLPPISSVDAYYQKFFGHLADGVPLSRLESLGYFSLPAGDSTLQAEYGAAFGRYLREHERTRSMFSSRSDDAVVNEGIVRAASVFLNADEMSEFEVRSHERYQEARTRARVLSDGGSPFADPPSEASGAWDEMMSRLFGLGAPQPQVCVPGTSRLSLKGLVSWMYQRLPGRRRSGESLPVSAPTSPRVRVEPEVAPIRGTVPESETIEVPGRERARRLRSREGETE